MGKKRKTQSFFLTEVKKLIFLNGFCMYNSLIYNELHGYTHMFEKK